MPRKVPQTVPEDQKSLSKLVEQMQRSSERFSLAALVANAKEQSIPVSWQDLISLGARDVRHRIPILPSYIARFISTYVSKSTFRRIIDPWAGAGSLLIPIAQENSTSEATGIVHTPEELVIARKMSAGMAINWMPGHEELAFTDLGTFDLLVSSPPLGLPSVKETLKTTNGAVPVQGSKTYVLALRAMQHLDEQGEAIVIFPNSFFFESHVACIREVLPQFGLAVNSVIALPSGAFLPQTAVELNIVFISRHSTADLFVGRLSPDQVPTALLANLNKRRVGAAPELGRLIPREDYRGWQALVATEEEQRLADRSGLTPVPLSEIAYAVNLSDRKSAESPFEDLANSVYVPLIGTSPAVSAISQLRIKPHNYAQLVINPDKAYAEFIARFLNSPLGRKVRNSLLRGAFIPKINKQSLLAATVYVLPLEAQKTAVDVGREVAELRLQLEQFESQLWVRPGDAQKLRKALGKLNQKEGFDAWLETLPFPLASILQRYDASINPEHKVNHLLNFFEATAQFLGSLMMSVFHSDPQYFQEHKSDWFEAGKGNRHSLAKSSFREWVIRGQRLAKTTRQLLSSEKDGERNFAVSLYGVSDPDKIAVVTDKDLYALLDRTAKYRNAWKGHGGLPGKKAYEQRLTILQEELTRLRGILGAIFEDWWLIRPGRNEYSAGIYHYHADRVMGSRQIFKQVEVESSVVMDSQELYFFDTTKRQPLRLLHFFRMMAVPEAEEAACYFLSRVEKPNVVWVSYHFERKEDRIEPDPSVIKLIEEVETNSV